MSFWGNLFNQVNPFDHGKTFSNPNPAPQPQQAPRPQVNIGQLMQSLQRAQSNTAPPQSVNRFFEPPQVHQPGLQPMDIIKSVANGFVNTAQLPYDTLRLGAGIVSRPFNNGQAMQNAAKAITGDAQNSLAGFAVRPAQTAVASGFQPMEINKAQQAKDYANKVLIPAYEALAQSHGFKQGIGTNFAQSEALQTQLNMLKDAINKSGVSYNDSIINNVIKAGPKIGSGVANAMLFGLGGGLGAQVLKGGALMGTAGMLDKSTQDNVGLKDVLKAGISPAIQGALLPVAFHAAGKSLGALSDTLAQNGHNSAFINAATNTLQELANQHEQARQNYSDAMSGLDNAQSKAVAEKNYQANNQISDQKLLPAGTQNFTLPNVEAQRILDGTNMLSKQYDKAYQEVLKTYGNTTPKLLAHQVDLLDQQFMGRHADLINGVGEFATQVPKQEVQLPISEATSSAKPAETATSPPQAKVPVGNTPENVAPSANTAFENAQVAPRSSIIDRFKNMLNPVAKFGEAGKQALSSFQSKLGDLANSLQGVKAQSALREDVFNRMSQQEQLKFINDMQHGVPQPTPQLQAIADQYTKFNQQGAQVAKQINPNFKEMANYFTQSGLMSKADASTLAQKWMDKSNTPGSLKQRQFPSVQEAVQFAVDNGVKLKETNPEKLFIHNHEAVLTSAKMKEFQAEQAKAGVNPEITQKIIDRYSESGLRGSATFQDYRKASGSLNSVQLFGGFHVLKSTFEKINNDVSVLVNEALKGHPIAAAKDFGHQLVENAKGFGYLQGRGLREDMANGVQNKYTDAAKQANFNTTTDPRYAINGITQSLNDITSGHFGQAAGGVLKAPFRLMNTMMKPIMSHYVVNLKNSAFMNHVDAIDHANPNIPPEAKARLYQEAGNTVDGIMGQMNQDNLFWSKTGKDIMSVLMRSPAYNIGTVQQVGGGLKDLLVPHPIRGLKGEGSVLPDSLQKLSTGQGLSTRSAYTLAMTGTTMTVGAMMTYMFTGKGPTDKLDYFYPPTGKTDKNGNKERVSLPSYTKDMFSLANNPGQTVINKAAPGLNIGASILTNKDFKGDMIRNTTGEDSLATQAGQIGNYLKTNAQPFSISSANNRVDKGLGAKVESALGLPVAPGYITKSGFQKTVEGSLNSALGHNPQTPEQQALSTAKSNAKQQAKFGDNTQIDALVKSGQLTPKQGDNLKLQSSQTSVQNQFNYLLKVDKVAAGKALAKASPADIAKLNPSDIAKSQDALAIDNAKKGNAGNFKVTGNTSQPTPTLSSSDITPLPSGKFNVNINGTDKTFSNKSQAQTAIDYQNFQDSGKNFATSSDGNTVFRVTNGNPSQMTKTAFDYQVGSATLVDRKNAGDLSGWMKTAQSQIESIKTQLQDPSVDAYDRLKLQNEATAIMTDAAKYQSYGGFTKGRSGNGARIALAGVPKVPTVKTRSVPKIKVAKTKTTKFASVKFAKPRRIKVK